MPVINALVNTLTRLGSIQCETGDYARARESYVESLRLMWQYVGRAYETTACLEGLARVAAMQDRPERAAWLLGAAAALRDETGTPLTPIARADHDHASEAARRSAGRSSVRDRLDDRQRDTLRSIHHRCARIMNWPRPIVPIPNFKL